MWSFENGIEVYEINCDALKVVKDDKVLGYIYPANDDDMELCKRDLDAGKDPITAGWEDGNGNTCTLNGWGEYAE